MTGLVTPESDRAMSRHVAAAVIAAVAASTTLTGAASGGNPSAPGQQGYVDAKVNGLTGGDLL